MRIGPLAAAGEAAE